MLAISSPQRSPLLAQAPTFNQPGYPELEIYIWSSLVARLNAEFNIARARLAGWAAV